MAPRGGFSKHRTKFDEKEKNRGKRGTQGSYARHDVSKVRHYGACTEPRVQWRGFVSIIFSGISCNYFRNYLYTLADPRNPIRGEEMEGRGKIGDSFLAWIVDYRVVFSW